MDAEPVEPTKNRVKNERAARSSGPKSLREAEAPGGFEPPHRGFADLCLTTWLRRLEGRNFAPGNTFLKLGFFRGLTGVASDLI